MKRKIPSKAAQRKKPNRSMEAAQVWEQESLSASEEESEDDDDDKAQVMVAAILEERKRKHSSKLKALLRTTKPKLASCVSTFLESHTVGKNWKRDFESDRETLSSIIAELTEAQAFAKEKHKEAMEEARRIVQRAAGQREEEARLQKQLEQVEAKLCNIQQARRATRLHTAQCRDRFSKILRDSIDKLNSRHL